MDAPFRSWGQMGQFLLQEAWNPFVLAQIVANDLLILPVVFAYISALWQTVAGISQAVRIAARRANNPTADPNIGLVEGLRVHVRSYGGYVVYGFMMARFVGSLSLLYLSLVAAPQKHCQHTPVYKFCVQPTVMTFAFSSVLAGISLFSRLLSDRARTHNTLLLLLTLAIYAYRDIWPLATYFLEPADAAEGNYLWAKISILAVTAILIPLFTPNAYVPADPEHPMSIPGRELVDPWISKALFVYIDPVVVAANKVSHLNFDQLPPLLDVDYASYVTKQAFPHLDPFVTGKRRHLFWGLMYTFRKEFFMIAVCLIATSASTFAAPISIINILRYLETHGEYATVKPWFWVILFFTGALSRSIVQHWELYLQTVILVRAQALLTQLVFEHSLRIRMKAETPSGKTASQPPTPSAPSIAEGETDEESSTAAESATSDNTSDNDGSQSSSTEVASPGESSRATSKASGKGKAKADSPEEVKKSTGDTGNLLGRINVLVTSDLGTIVDGTDFLTFVIYVPLQICLSLIFLGKVLGWSAFVSLFVTLGLGPIAGFLAKKIQDVQTVKMKKTDARVQTISEAIGVIRMVKLFGWETNMSKKVEEKREEELRWIWKTSVLNVTTNVVSNVIPTLAMFATYATYTVIMKEELSASKIFSSITVFNILRNQIGQISWQAGMIVQTKVSLDRFTNFLNETELLDRFTSKSKQESSLDVLSPSEESSQNDDIGFRNATFVWSAQETDGSLTPTSRYFRLHIEGELLFKRNCINMIVGPTGSGKTSLLMALLGEMHFIPSQVDSWFNLPRGGNIAYAAQESWVQSATIRENILFGSAYDEERYKKVIHQCALERDLELFEAGDHTEVGERGLTLSGGQKARVTLARAIYSDAQIILLDDVLAALDVHTSVWIVNKCFRGDLVKGRTIILVTHNIALVGSVAGFVVSLGVDGRVQMQGTDISGLLKSNPRLASEIEEEKKALEEEETKTDSKTDTEPAPKTAADGKLVVAEEIVQGHVTWNSMKLLVTALGGNYPFLFFTVLIGGAAVSTCIYTAQTWFLGVWGTQYETHSPPEVRLYFYLSVFASIIVAHITISASLQLFYTRRMLHASRAIHAKLIDSVFGSTFRWLDETPTGRIIARCTQDIRAIDGVVPSHLMLVINLVMSCLVNLGAIVLFTPIFIFPGLAVGIAGALMGNWYLRAQLSIKREMSNARSPLLSHFNAAMHGLVSIRAYGAQHAFREESLKRIDHYSRIARTSWNLNRWIGLRMDLLGAIFVALLAFYQIYVQTTGAAATGFSLNMAVGFCGMIFYLIRIYNTFEVESNSLERIQGYLNIDHEPKPSEGRKPPASWPTSGDLRVEELSARYSATGPEVLHNLSFHIKSGEHIGVVGRTGSGKSSLTLALLRCILTEGTVFYDGVPVQSINLDALRSNITIIPQTPELLSGTLRQNLDPFEENDDAVLNDALRSAGLFSLQEEAEESYLTLDSSIAGGGGNLSIGQRQIIALARAMVRGSKLLILDEATSAIDYKTDAIIQRSLRTQLGSDITVITVAHRLQTIMDADRIMVLDKGHIVEFDSPKNLLQIPNGVFKALVDGSEDREALYELQESTTKS